MKNLNKHIRTCLLLLSVAPLSMAFASNAEDEDFTPIRSRVNVQASVAPDDAIIDGEWVAVGTKVPHAIGYDNTVQYKGEPSYRFWLQPDDNTLSGYSAGETKGRAEFSRAYATQTDVAHLSETELENAIICKTVYHHGKDIAAQGSSKSYRFAIYVSSSSAEDVNTIFAQWHGMPSRTLLQTPEGEVKTVTEAEFVELSKTTTFKKNMGVDIKTKKPNGWLVEQGGYPPLAFGFNSGYFYIKANSDRRWLTDKTDRCNANVERTGIMQSEKSKYKESTIAYKMPYKKFPKDTWVEFEIEIDWTTYGKEKETIEKPGRLNVLMDGKPIVDNETIQIGRNDEDGYYFKFGIYRVGGSTKEVKYNLAGYREW